MAQPTQITVIPHNKFSELGYVPIVHPDGYIYFAKNCDSATADADQRPAENIGNFGQVVKADPVSHDDDWDNDATCADHTTEEAEDDLPTSKNAINYGYAHVMHRVTKKPQDTKDSKLEDFKLTLPSKVYPSKSKNLSKEFNGDSDDIVQKRPTVPKGSYVRKRAHSAVHFESWKIKLKSLGFISCHFSNCRFLAMSLKDMNMHYGYCLGDSSFAEFECSICGGVVTTQEILDEHIARSHIKVEKPAKITTLSRPNILRRKLEVPPHTLPVPIADPFIAPTVGIGDREALQLPSHTVIPSINITVEEASLTPRQDARKLSDTLKKAYDSKFKMEHKDFIRNTPAPSYVMKGRDSTETVSSTCAEASVVVNTYSKPKTTAGNKMKVKSEEPPRDSKNRLRKLMDSLGKSCERNIHSAENRAENDARNLTVVENQIDGTSVQSKKIKTIKDGNSMREISSPSPRHQVQPEKEYPSRRKSDKSNESRLKAGEETNARSVLQCKDASPKSYELPVQSMKDHASVESVEKSKTSVEHVAVTCKTISVDEEGDDRTKKNEGKAVKVNENSLEKAEKQKPEPVITSSVDHGAKAVGKYSSLTEKEEAAAVGKRRNSSRVTEKTNPKLPTPREESDEDLSDIISEQVTSIDAKEGKGTSEAALVAKRRNSRRVTVDTTTKQPISNSEKNPEDIKNDLLEDKGGEDKEEAASVGKRRNSRQVTADISPKQSLANSGRIPEDREKEEAAGKGTSEVVKIRNSRRAAADNTPKQSLANSGRIPEDRENNPLEEKGDKSKGEAAAVGKRRFSRRVPVETTPKQPLTIEASENEASSVAVENVISKDDQSKEGAASEVTIETAPEQPTIKECENNVSGSVILEDTTVPDSSLNAIKKRSTRRSKHEAPAVENVRSRRKKKQRINSDSSDEVVLSKVKISKNIPDADLPGTSSCDAHVTQPSTSRDIPVGESSSLLVPSPDDDVSSSQKTMKCTEGDKKGPSTRKKRGSRLSRQTSQGAAEASQSEPIGAEENSEDLVPAQDIVPNIEGIRSDQVEESSKTPDSTETPVKRKRGRPRRDGNDGKPTSSKKVKREPSPPKEEEEPREPGAQITCGKCEKSLREAKWDVHNGTKHVGLGWRSDEPPFDPTQADSKEVLNRVRTAFRLHTKSATCELCGTVKKSFLGFHAHVTFCGKSHQDRIDALEECEKCGKRVMPYSMSTHMKTHDEALIEALVVPLTKRRSAIKALSTLKNVTGGEKQIHSYKKGDALPAARNELYQRLGSKQNCKREGCGVATPTVHKYTDHYFNCPTLPDVVYYCNDCFYLGQTDEVVKRHRCKDDVEKDEYEASTDEDNPLSDHEDTRKRQRTAEITFTTSAAENALKRICFSREKLRVSRSAIHERALELESKRQSEWAAVDEQFRALTTCLEDWTKLSEEERELYMPPVKTSLKLQINKTDVAHQKVPVFQPIQSETCIGGFAGGPIQTLAWCPIHMTRSRDARQYLALSTSSQTDSYPWIRANNTETALLQIWDVGQLCGASGQKPKMAVAIAMEFGELWNIAWAPFDTHLPATADTLARIGLIATACHDGKIRVYSISCPSEDDMPSVYRVRASVELTKDSIGSDACLRLNWGDADGGVICGGFASGTVAFWYLNALTSSRTARRGSTYLLRAARVFHAQPSPITCLSLYPGDANLLATGGADKRLHFWDVRNPGVPVRSETGTQEPKLMWFRNWPLQIYQLDENTVTSVITRAYSMGHPSLRFSSHVQDISVSDWCLTSAYGLTSGEVVIRQHTDPYVDQKKLIMTWVPAVAKCSEPVGSYRAAESKDVTLTFINKKWAYSDGRSMTDASSPEPCGADINLTSVDKVAINPNYMTFDHVAVGYHCGFFRLVRASHVSRRIEEL